LHILDSMGHNNSIEELLRQWLLLRQRGESARAAALRLSDQINGPVQGFGIAVQSAIAECFPLSTPMQLRALCVTERSGNRRKDICCEAETDRAGRLRLTGQKTFVTLGSAASQLLVAAKSFASGASTDEFRMVVVQSNSPGVMSRFVSSERSPPELSHSEFFFAKAPVVEALPGDAFNAYLRRFRVIEDLYLYLVTCRHIEVMAARSRWPFEVEERAASLVEALNAELDEDLLAPASVLRSARVFTKADMLFTAVGALFPPQERDDWDKAIQLVKIGASARQARIERSRRSSPSD